MKPGITVVTPSIPERADMLARAVRSVAAQTLLPAAHVITLDARGDGAAKTRTRGLHLVQTEWTAFLDDDDEFKPEHLSKLAAFALSAGADFVFPWFDVVGGTDPFPANEHREFDLADPHQTTVTVLVRTRAALDVGGFEWEADPENPGTDAQGNRAGEEFNFAIKIARAGYSIAHLHEHTWLWHHHGQNTQGLASRRTVHA